MKFMHASDMHLGQGVRGEARGRASSRELFFLVFEDLLAAAAGEEVDLLFLAGDILESARLRPADCRRLRTLLAAPRAYGILAVAGNHDPLNDSSPWLEIAADLPNFHLFSSRTTERMDFADLDLTVYGTSFHALYEDAGLLPCENALRVGAVRPGGHPGLGAGVCGGERIAAERPKPPLRRKVSLIHGDLGTGFSIEEAEAGYGYNRLTVEDLRGSGVDYAALGHYHLARIGEAGETLYAYSGTPQGAGFDEAGPHGAYLGTWTDRRPELHFRRLSRADYRITEIDLTGLTDDGAAADRVLRELQRDDPERYAFHRYKIVLTGGRSEDYRPDLEAIRMRLASELAYAEIRDRSRPAVDRAKLRKEESLRGAYVRALEALAEEVPQPIFEAALNYGLEAMRDKGALEL